LSPALEYVKTGRKLRILDFDCEARPLSWISSDYVSKEVTAICAKFIGEKPVHVWLLGVDEPHAMLEGFRALYDEADMVCGHNVRRYDLPTLNGAMVEHGLPKLGDKLAHDTYRDLLKKDGLSFSQASLGAMLGLQAPKVGMDQAAWRKANRLVPGSFEVTRKRVVGDVLQNIELRKRLLELGYLGPPRVWRSN
jgi:hypothetical protein